MVDICAKQAEYVVVTLLNIHFCFLRSAEQWKIVSDRLLENKGILAPSWAMITKQIAKGNLFLKLFLLKYR